MDNFEEDSRFSFLLEDDLILPDGLLDVFPNEMELEKTTPQQTPIQQPPPTLPPSPIVQPPPVFQIATPNPFFSAPQQAPWQQPVPFFQNLPYPGNSPLSQIQLDPSVRNTWSLPSSPGTPYANLEQQTFIPSQTKEPAVVHQPPPQSPQLKHSATELIQTCFNANQISQEKIQQHLLQQREFLRNPTDQGWEAINRSIQQIRLDLENQEKVLNYVHSSRTLEPFPLHQQYSLSHDISVQSKQVELLMCELHDFVKSIRRWWASLVISQQPFPEIIFKGKQLSDEVLHVRLITGAGVVIQNMSLVHAELMLETTKKSSKPAMTYVDQPLNEHGIAKFPLRFNRGSRGALVSIKFSLKVQFEGQPSSVTIESPASRPFMIITHDNQWQASLEMIIKKDSFLGNLEVSWPVCANALQRHFLRATKQHPVHPERYLSKNDFEYFHSKFFHNLEFINQQSFDKFWNYFGEAIRLLRFKNTVKLWQAGLLYGFMSRDDINSSLMNREPGTFIIRFSENWPGQMALGYICEEGHIKHHLLESAELKNQTFVDWIIIQRQFTHVLQCVGFSPETKKPIFKRHHKNLAFSPFFSSHEQPQDDVKPGYDPLNNSWTQLASDEALRRQLKKARS